MDNKQLEESIIDEIVKKAVNRFLSWKLPPDFNPDGGISFKAGFNEHTEYPMKNEPMGTNLFTAQQTQEMINYILGDSLSNIHEFIKMSVKRARRIEREDIYFDIKENEAIRFKIFITSIAKEFTTNGFLDIEQIPTLLRNVSDDYFVKQFKENKKTNILGQKLGEEDIRIPLKENTIFEETDKFKEKEIDVNKYSVEPISFKELEIMAFNCVDYSPDATRKNLTTLFDKIKGKYNQV